MSYLTQPAASNRKLVPLVIALLLHVALGYAFYTGLAQDVIKSVVDPIEAVAVEEEKELEEPPPPPEQQLEEIQVQTPPPLVSIETPPPPNAIVTETTIIRPTPPVAIAPRPAPPVQVAAPPAPAAPEPVVAASRAKFRGNRKTIITQDDYPSAAQRSEEEGTVGFRIEVNAKGTVDSCTVTSPSGSRSLDETTCRLVQRRFKYIPAVLQGGSPTSQTINDKVTWNLEEGR